MTVTEPAPKPADHPPDGDCNDEPKLTADEWAYVEAVTAAEDAD